MTPDPRVSASLLPDGHVEFGHDCVNGWVTGVLPSPPWTVVKADPLTVTPSVWCQVEGCALHGWITDGWLHFPGFHFGYVSEEPDGASSVPGAPQ